MTAARPPDRPPCRRRRTCPSPAAGAASAGLGPTLIRRAAPDVTTMRVMSSALTDLLPATRSCRPRWRAAPPARSWPPPCPRRAGSASSPPGTRRRTAMYEEIKQLRGADRSPLRRQSLHAAARAPPTPPPSRSTPTSSRARPPGTRPRSATRTPGGDDGYDAKLAILLDDPVPVGLASPSAARPATVLDAFAEGRHATPSSPSPPPRRRSPPSGRVPTRCASRASRRAATRAPTATTRRPDGTGHRAALPGPAGPRGRAAAGHRGGRADARQPDRRRAGRGRGRRAARHRLPGHPGVRGATRCTSRP